MGNKQKEYNFNWYSKENGPAIISVAYYGITFNKAAVDLLNNPKYIKLGIDKNNKLIAVKPLEKNSEDSFIFSEKRNEKYGSVRINNKGFIKLIKSTYSQYDLSETIQFILEKDKELNMFLVDLNSPVNISDK
jgi:hypothetical protein